MWQKKKIGWTTWIFWEPLAEKLVRMLSSCQAAGVVMVLVGFHKVSSVRNGCLHWFSWSAASVAINWRFVLNFLNIQYTNKDEILFLILILMIFSWLNADNRWSLCPPSLMDLFSRARGHNNLTERESTSQSVCQHCNARQMMLCKWSWVILVTGIWEISKGQINKIWKQV